MTLLGQQELVTPEPSRRIIVPRGHGAWWGVDPSTLRVAVAGVSRAAGGSLVRWAATQSFAPADGPGRLSAIYDGTHALVTDWLLNHSGPSPGLVLVEQPGGEFRNYELFYATGVIVAAMDAGIYHATGQRARMEMVVPSWWKKRACGAGNIYKPKRRGDEYGVLTWARANGYTGLSWDEADAWGIAEAARRTVALDER